MTLATTIIITARMEKGLVLLKIQGNLAGFDDLIGGGGWTDIEADVNVVCMIYFSWLVCLFINYDILYFWSQRCNLPQILTASSQKEIFWRTFYSLPAFQGTHCRRLTKNILWCLELGVCWEILTVCCEPCSYTNHGPRLKGTDKPSELFH